VSITALRFVLEAEESGEVQAGTISLG
jgi:hypothetical protein